ncbi:hypothetical protein LINGRAHAP2_LOCUS5636 [Linum grandiflorum]
MKNTIRCCISCILPCGALDVIRIVHTNGRVEEITGSILASEVMKAHPRHVLKKPSSAGCADYHGVVPKIVIVPPDAQLQRGKIYFLMPLPPSSTTSTSAPAAKSSRRRVSKEKGGGGNCKSAAAGEVAMTSDDRYLSEIMSTEKVLSAGQRDRRRSGGGGRAGVWRPHLESISESAFNISSSSSSSTTTDRDSLC